MHLQLSNRDPHPGRAEGGRSWILLAVLLLSVFLGNVARYRFLCDDAFITFRYAENVATGLGPVWNPGEHVEGYTSPLWVLLMAASIRLGLPPELTSQVLGVLSGIGVLALLALFCRKTWPDRPWAVWLLLAVLAASRSFTAWCTSGMETMLFTFLVLLGFLLLLRARTSARLHLPSSLVLVLATLTRPEGLLFAGVAGVFLLVDAARGRRRLAAAVSWLLLYVALVGAHLLWRHGYYGYWLPNTWYAKVPGLWLEQSRRYLSLFEQDYHIAWFLPFAGLAVLRRRDATALLFAVATGLYLGYVLAIGGDRFEFRFLVVVFPFLYWLIVDGLSSLARPGFLAAVPRPVTQGGVAVVAVALVLLTHLGSIREEARGRRAGVASVQAAGRYATRRAEEGRFLRSRIDQGVLPEDLVICVGGAGAVPYYTRWPAIDRRGLNDAYIAHLPVAERGQIAHEHDVPYEYLLERGVVVFDILNQLVHEEIPPGLPEEPVRHGSGAIPMRIVVLGDRYLVFGSLVSDEELARVFRGLEIRR